MKELRHDVCPTCGGTGSHIAVNPGWLIYQRKAAALALREVARRLGFSAGYICDMEHGRRAVSVKVHKFYKGLQEKTR